MQQVYLCEKLCRGHCVYFLVFREVFFGVLCLCSVILVLCAAIVFCVAIRLSIE